MLLIEAVLDPLNDHLLIFQNCLQALDKVVYFFKHKHLPAQVHQTRYIAAI